MTAGRFAFATDVDVGEFLHFSSALTCRGRCLGVWFFGAAVGLRGASLLHWQAGPPWAGARRMSAAMLPWQARQVPIPRSRGQSVQGVIVLNTGILASTPWQPKWRAEPGIGGQAGSTQLRRLCCGHETWFRPLESSRRCACICALSCILARAHRVCAQGCREREHPASGSLIKTPVDSFCAQLVLAVQPLLRVLAGAVTSSSRHTTSSRWRATSRDTCSRRR